MKTSALGRVLTVTVLMLLFAATAAGCATNMSEADKALWNDHESSTTKTAK